MHAGRTALTLISVVAVFALAARAAFAGDPPAHIVFPVVGKTSYIDDFGDPRPQGLHQGNDVMAHRHQLVVAAEAGTVQKWHQSGATGLCMLYLYGRSDTEYLYIHLNNDLTAHNDNEGGCRNGVSWAPGLRNGQHVRRGQLLGYVGDSGDANGIHPHLHFELHPHGGSAVSPYKWLRSGRHLLYAAPYTVHRLSLRLTGYVGWTSPRLHLRVRGVYASTKGHARVHKAVGVAIADDVVVQRRTKSGSLRAATLATVQPGDHVRAYTTRFAQSFATQVGAKGALTAKRIVVLPD